MHYSDTNKLLPIYIILGVSDFAILKMRTCLRVGQIGEPLAKQTKMGWVIMPPGKESDIVSALFNKAFFNDYERLCDTDVLKLKANH